MVRHSDRKGSPVTTPCHRANSQASTEAVPPPVRQHRLFYPSQAGQGIMTSNSIPPSPTAPYNYGVFVFECGAGVDTIVQSCFRATVSKLTVLAFHRTVQIVHRRALRLPLRSCRHTPSNADAKHTRPWGTHRRSGPFPHAQYCTVPLSAHPAAVEHHGKRLPPPPHPAPRLSMPSLCFCSAWPTPYHNQLQTYRF